MKKLILFLSVFLFGYEAKVQPFETYIIKAAVGGEVVKTYKNLEAKNLKNALIVKLDDKVEKANLKNIKNQIDILKQEIKNQEEIVKRKKSIYLRYQKLSSKSVEQKDMKFYDYIASFNQLLNLKSNLSNLNDQKVKIKDLIDKKNIKFSGYLYEITVSKDDYVAPGIQVGLGYDISKEKINIFVPIDKINYIKNKKVYINGKKSDFKIYKIWNVTDTKYITSYKVELVGKGLKLGNIVKIEFKTN